MTKDCLMPIEEVSQLPGAQLETSTSQNRDGTRDRALWRTKFQGFVLSPLCR